MQQLLKAWLQLLTCQRHTLLRFSVHVVKAALHSTRLIGDLTVIDPVRQLHKPRERYVAGGETANPGSAPGPVCGSALAGATLTVAISNVDFALRAGPNERRNKAARRERCGERGDCWGSPVVNLLDLCLILHECLRIEGLDG